MTTDRINELETFGDSKLTESEISEGWHFCYDWDGLLIGPGMMETKHCNCFDEDHK